MKLKWIYGLLISLFALTLLGGCQSPAQGAKKTPAQPSIQLTACKLPLSGGGSIDARCGTLDVDEDPAARSGKKITLKLAVIPAISRTPEPDAFVLLAGGPGESGLDSFPNFVEAFSRIRKTRDIVIFDQRGTGASNPLRCPAVETREAEYELSQEEQIAEISKCQRSLNVDTRLYNTSTSVEDLEQIRQALGYPQLNLMGVSYGTRYALAYLRQYSQNVRSVVLDGVVPTQWELGPLNQVNAQRALDLMFARCAKDAECQKAYPDLQKEWAEVLSWVSGGPVKVQLNHPVTGEPRTIQFDRKKLGMAIMIFSYEPETVALLPRLIHQTYETHNFERIAAQAMSSETTLDSSIAEGFYLSTLCAEDVPYYQAVPAGAYYLTDPSKEMQSICAAWPASKAPAEFKQPVTSDKPVLLLSGEADPVTPPANAEIAARTLSNSLHVVAPGMGHGIFQRGCATRVIGAFVEQGSVQNLDTACLLETKPQPFFLNLTATTP